MNSVETAIDALLEKNLEAMRESINRALAEKAAEALEERKTQLATTYFEKK